MDAVHHLSRHSHLLAGVFELGCYYAPGEMWSQARRFRSCGHCRLDNRSHDFASTYTNGPASTNEMATQGGCMWYFWSWSLVSPRPAMSLLLMPKYLGRGPQDTDLHIILQDYGIRGGPSVLYFRHGLFGCDCLATPSRYPGDC